MTHEQATKWVYERYKKLAADRRDVASRFKDIVLAVEQKGVTPPTLRLSARLDSMTPAARDKWRASLVGSLKLFGVDEVGVMEAPTKEADPTLWGAVQQCRHLRTERLGITEALRELAETAKENKVDLGAIKDLVRYQAKSNRGEGDEKPADYFDALDYVGRIVGAWE